MNAFESVREFHRANGQTINVEFKQLSAKDMLLRTRLILEELGELSVAIHQDNAIETADGLGDLLYVILGTAVSLGLPVQDKFYEPDRGRTISGEIEFYHNFHLGTIASAVSSLLEKVRFGVENDIHLALDRVTRVIGVTARERAIPFKEVFFEIHRSNMTKRLGGASDGKKYGTENAKGVGYQPPRIAEILAGKLP